jgi:hypothetical protein
MTMNKIADIAIQLAGICVLIGFLNACELDTGNYPDIPAITLKSAEGKWMFDYESEQIVRSFNLHFYVIDGDGDMGVMLGDTGTNFFMDMYRIKNGVFEKDSAYNATIPAPYDLGQDKTYKADIYIDLIHAYLTFDTVYYRFYVVDQAGHQSNTLQTDTIIFGPRPN